MSKIKKTSDLGEVKPFRVKGQRCPICKKSAVADHRPFCSKRCSQIDLGRWLGEVYRAPADDDPGDAEIWSEVLRRDGDV